MAPAKLYIGRKVRQIREQNNATQAFFAERLGISTSYLNQIENNQRPVSASVLIALADRFRIDIAEISAGENERLLSALSEAFTDPLFDAYSPTVQELKLITQNAPTFAHALITSHQAYRRKSEQLASFDDRLERPGAYPETTPYEEVRDFFHFVDNYIHDLDLIAEALAERLSVGNRDSYLALTTFLESEFDVRTIVGERGEDFIRRFDAQARTLTLNPYLPIATKAFQVAFQIANLHAGAKIEEIAFAASFRSEEAQEICRVGLQNYFAGALVLPYRKFLLAARELRHDIELLAVRFGTSLEQVCHRLSTLQRPGEKGVPLFFARIDRAGNITKRHSSAKLQFARFGAACPLWNAHQAFEAPGKIIRQLAETPDGVRYLCLAVQVNKGLAGFKATQTPYALALGCEISYSDEFVYADDIYVGSGTGFDPIGISCRICERVACPSRAIPPVKRKLSVDHSERGILPYNLP
ncbi:short-chain fatty acyl-CoA regulator family protein [Agrobacterium sp. NPDC090273]|uniref:helix-turn-helix domain-containing protein n=1 Tax=Agrobacterium sp. NPDC090273 TaxID=3363919 RepID=UPI00383BCED0